MKGIILFTVDGTVMITIIKNAYNTYMQKEVSCSDFFDEDSTKREFLLNLKNKYAGEFTFCKLTLAVQNTAII